MKQPLKFTKYTVFPGLPSSSPHHSNGDIPHNRSVASRQRSRSGQSSPVRSTLLVDMPSEGLVRSNSDTSLMVNLDGKGDFITCIHLQAESMVPDFTLNLDHSG